MSRKELDTSTPLVLGQDSTDEEGCPVGQGDPMFVLVWACLDALSQKLHGPIEKIISEVKGLMHSGS